jgi:hypothetical protein
MRVRALVFVGGVCAFVGCAEMSGMVVVNGQPLGAAANDAAGEAGAPPPDSAGSNDSAAAAAGGEVQVAQAAKRYEPVTLATGPGITSGEWVVPAGAAGVEISVTSSTFWEGHFSLPNEVACGFGSIGDGGAMSGFQLDERPNEPTKVVVNAAPGAVCRAMLVKKNHPWKTLEVVGAPAPDSTVAMRAVGLHTEQAEWRVSDSLDPTWVSMVMKAFQTLPDSYFVYANDLPQELWERKARGPSLDSAGPPRAGEPLLLWRHRTGNLALMFVRDIGQHFLVSDLRHDDVATTTRPAAVVLPAPIKPAMIPEPPVGEWSEEEFAVLAPENARVVAYLEKKKKLTKCVDDMFLKLDPDHRAGAYDVVTTGPGGGKKVESYTARLRRTKIDPVCKTAAVRKEAAAIRTWWKKDVEKSQRDGLAAVAKRFGS